MRYFLTTFFLFSASAFAKSGLPPSTVVFAAKAAHKVLLGCPERLWPNVDWADVRFLFVSQGAHAWLVTPQDQRAQTVAAKDIPALGDMPFDVINDNGRITIAVNLDSLNERDGAEAAFTLGIHELFHNIGQFGWARPLQARGTVIPLNSQPRYQRAMLLKELAQGHLGVAARWFQSWQADSPSEVEATVDTNEGTAKYIERQALALNQFGCAAQQTQLDQFHMKWIKKLKVTPEDGLDGEGYLLGATAGLLLDQLGVEWKTQVGHGRSPLNILLDAVSPGPATDDPKEAKRVEEGIEGLNSEVEQWILPFSEARADASFWRVAIPQSETTYSINAFFVPRQEPELTFELFSGEQTLAHPELGSLKFIDDAIVVEGLVSPCTPGQAFVVIPKSKVTLSDGIYHGKALSIEFDLRLQAVHSADGFDYLCPK